MRIAMIGCGSMGSAVLEGLLASGRDRSSVRISVRSRERAAQLSAHYGVTCYSLEDNPAGNVEAVAEASVVILAVKPQVLIDALWDISESLPEKALVVSLAAAIPLTSIEGQLASTQPTLRALPNTPIRFAQGVVALTPGSMCTPDMLQAVTTLFQGCALVVEVAEEWQDSVSAISGAGPAYLCYVLEALTEAATQLGLPPVLASQIVRQTAIGTGTLLARSSDEPSVLRRAVTSPKGMTHSAISVFENQGLPHIISDGAKAAVRRAEEMKELDGYAPCARSKKQSRSS